MIGGGHFLGPAVVRAGLGAGHVVTTLTRSGLGVPAGAQSLLGDRETAEGLSVLRGGEWDAVVDTCGYVPRMVGTGARALADVAGHYVFVSSISAYDGWPERPVTADTPLLACPADAGPDDGGYGELKAGCERAVLEYLPGRCMVARVGHLVGIGDNVGRLPYWIRRVARGGEVLAPGPPQRPLSMVDVRDVGTWLVECGQSRLAGAMAASGPPGQTSFGCVVRRRRGSNRIGPDVRLGRRRLPARSGGRTVAGTAVLVARGAVPRRGGRRHLGRPGRRAGLSAGV